MSHLRVVVRPGLVTGFQLAGVEAYGAEDVEAAEALVTGWLDGGEVGLLAIEDYLLDHMGHALIKRLDDSDRLLYLVIPGGRPHEAQITRTARIARLIRRAVGVQIAFGGARAEVPDEE